MGWGWDKGIEYTPEETEKDLKYWCNRMDGAIADFCESYGIKDLRSESQNLFSACIKYIYTHVFDKRLYKDDDSIKDPDPRVKGIIGTDNIDLITGLLEHYIYMCDLYCKAVNVVGFSNLIGLDLSIIYDWYNGVLRVDNPNYAKIFSKLDQERERSLSDLLISGKKTNIGILAVLNHEKGWNLPGTSREVHHVASVEDPAAIMERYRSRLADAKISGNLSDNSDSGTP